MADISWEPWKPTWIPFLAVPPLWPACVLHPPHCMSHSSSGYPRGQTPALISIVFVALSNKWIGSSLPECWKSLRCLTSLCCQYIHLFKKRFLCEKYFINYKTYIFFASNVFFFKTCWLLVFRVFICPLLNSFFKRPYKVSRFIFAITATDAKLWRGSWNALPVKKMSHLLRKTVDLLFLGENLFKLISKSSLAVLHYSFLCMQEIGFEAAVKECELMSHRRGETWGNLSRLVTEASWSRSCQLDLSAVKRRQF